MQKLVWGSQKLYAFYGRKKCALFFSFFIFLWLLLNKKKIMSQIPQRLIVPREESHIFPHASRRIENQGKCKD